MTRHRPSPRRSAKREREKYLPLCLCVFVVDGARDLFLLPDRHIASSANAQLLTPI